MEAGLRRHQVRALVLAHPGAFGVGLTAAWWVMLVVLARGLPPLAPAWLPDLGPTLVNLGALVVPLS